jgi:hypothetical protein
MTTKKLVENGSAPKGVDLRDRQIETAPAHAELYEVLTVAPSGFRTVHRLRAKDRGTAEAEVTESLVEGHSVLGAAKAGCGLGSGDQRLWRGVPTSTALRSPTGPPSLKPVPLSICARIPRSFSRD